ncbi:MAG TPA: peptide-methionine (S)-S-oxide reductase MsrA [Ignavibacteriaceae bacterium]|jgi:peptide-methionine (S)-S-oxide reductase|nr:MAG: Peptide methionine sulfoxide reductase MsrA [Ignavibacteria bacterium ADurb.Bin266]HQF43623.1 peptide-methionine (S)-S-oxide reductase MsrA [Ignavibacteriaceae bacterium]HQI41101.1 peptide-methionine (S)-S-oxide reductase MsrA [Ignavibacteriaceae bacterium]
MKVILFITYALFLVTLNPMGCNKIKSTENLEKKNIMNINNSDLDTATLGTGCFWCTEAIFERVNGVVSVISGYSGGNIANPTYEEVCEGTTGHAECTQITFDPSIISYDELLEIFWKTHDPTTLNKQGNDVGTQYRSVIFYHNNEQKQKAEYYKQKLTDEKIWDKPIVTEITKFEKFYPAENYHQEYYENNPNQGYCVYVITPKVEKFEKIFNDKLKK